MSDHEQCLVVVFLGSAISISSFRTSHLTMLMLNVTFRLYGTQVLASECFERNILDWVPVSSWKP